MTRLPMFPLPMPLLPGMGLPLQVFEPRYHALLHDVVEEGDGRFGVALITRGHQVGGGDLRSMVGTEAEVLDHQHLDDGRRIVLAVGRQRLRIRRWLRDDPYPLAEVEAWPDEPTHTDRARRGDDVAAAGEPSAAPDGPGLDDDRSSGLGRIDVQGRLDDIVALVAATLAEDDRTILLESSNLPRDVDLAIWQATIVADLGPLDRQRLLACPGRNERLPMLVDMLEERRDVLAFTLDT